MSDRLYLMYFKVTNLYECHDNFRYKTGLNVLKASFNKKGQRISGGLYFTTLEHLDKFCMDGVWLREITIPEKTKIIMYAGGKCMADRIIMGEKYPLYDVKTIKKFNLKINECYIQGASRNGQVEFLEWWKNSRKKIKWKLFGKDKCRYNVNAIDFASHGGQIEVLEWWKNSGLKLKYTRYAIESASVDGNIKVLNWWKNSGLTLCYGRWAFDGAASDGNLKVMNWWKNSGLKLYYTDYALNWSALSPDSSQYNPEILDWWLKAHRESGLKLKYTHKTLVILSENGDLNTLKILNPSKSMIGKTTTTDMTKVFYNASKDGYVKILDWWFRQLYEYGLRVSYDETAMDWASVNGKVKVLDWWLRAHNEFGLELKYTDYAIENASTFGRISVLDWWLRAHYEFGLELKYTSLAIQEACGFGQVKVLDWWLRAHNEFGLRLEYDHDIAVKKASDTRRSVFSDTIRKGCDDVLEWLSKHKEENET